ncbi:hypothetical protein SNE40_016806 [Patella caerulea]|uniref:Platelet-derived growth factor (PDGF) family profile domain-containing protein n=1 Tax=Patella caerulea TaxID=87958 RepID=A0AAN8JAQ1_PATCE
MMPNFAVLLSYLLAVTQAETYLERLRNIGSVEEFLAMVVKDGHPMSIEDVYPFASSNHGEKEYISGGLVLAAPDECSPRPMAVEIPRAPGDTANTIYWPECTRVMRCGGCCPSAKLACVADEVENTVLHVLKAIAREEGSLHLDWVGPLAVNISIHRSCRLQCRLTPVDCKHNQMFIPDECSCVCRHQYICNNPRQRWNGDSCRCICPGSRNCGRNTIYDENQCRCVILEEAQEANIALGGTMSQADIDAYLLENNGSIDSVQRQPTLAPTTPTTTTTTTTTTTPAPTVNNGPCFDVRCPPFWRKEVRNGRCLCQPRYG